MRAALLIALSAATLVHAEQSQTPPRDSARAAQSSPGRIRGRVLAADTGQPLGRAEVSISGQAPAIQSTLTDAEGRYEFADVPPGTFQVMASKTGYVNLQFGQRRPFEPGRPIAVGAGQTVDRIDVSLPRGAVITARVTDDLGFPMAAVQVRVHRYQYRSDGQRVLAQVFGGPGPSIGLTDDRGEIRVFGLMPGEYVVSTLVTPFRAGIGTSARGGDGYVPTFYPGVINVSQAIPIAVGVGEERMAPFPIARSRLARISGVIVDTQGRPANGANVMLATAIGNTPMARVGVDGTFAITDVAPGDYAVMVNYDTFEDWPQMMTVAGVDIQDLRLVVGGGTTVSGRVVFEGGAPSRATASSFRATLWSATPPPAPGILTGQRSITIDEDGRFRFSGVAGRIMVGATVPQGWMVKSVVAEGRDVSDDVIDLASRARMPDLTVTVTNRVTTLSGQVTDERAQPVPEDVVVIVPVETYHPGVMAQRVKALRPGPSGTFTTQGMRPGRYVAVAVSALEDGRHFSPEFQQQVRRIGQEFTLGEGQTAALNLRLTPDL